ncbi:hypothetical protein [Bradyrhizobium sp. RT9a]|uniref:hypothetical protein n=1 Tax=Bradyrhizobium sp. RT9a TaxID=3156384 RepID=UPI003393C55B
MRAVILLFLTLAGMGSVRAGDVNWRLDQLEYESRRQRYDLDTLTRQRALDRVDAMDRDARSRERAAIDQLQRDPLESGTAPLGRSWPLDR